MSHVRTSAPSCERAGCHRACRSRPQRGLTLVELLVTLVLTSAIAALLGTALHQLARIEDRLQGARLRGAIDSLHAEWVRQMLETVQPAPSADDALQGDAGRLAGRSALVPGHPAPQAARFVLRVERLTGPDRQRLVLERPDEPDTPERHATLLEWPGHKGRLRYLDAQGRWLERWPAEDRPIRPPPTVNDEAAMLAWVAAMAPPRLIALDTGSVEQGVIAAAPRLAPRPRPTRAQAEGL